MSWLQGGERGCSPGSWRNSARWPGSITTAMRPGSPSGFPEGVALGESIAVNGVCLTVTGILDGTFTADVMGETLSRSGLGALAPGDPVNLERSVRLADRIGGHLVQGHVDGTATIISRTPAEHWDGPHHPPGRARPVHGGEGLDRGRRDQPHRLRAHPARHCAQTAGSRSA